MALLVSKRVRKNFSSQVFGNGGEDHGPLIIGYARNDVMIPGQYAGFLGREFTHHDFLNTVINWSSNDGAGGDTNRQYFLGYSVMRQGGLGTNFYSDENGCYLIGQLPINVISEGTIGSVFILNSTLVARTNWVYEPTAIVVPTASSGMSMHSLAIGAATSSTTFNAAVSFSSSGIGGSTSGYDGTNYVYRQTGQTNAEVYGFNKLLLVTDSVGVSNGSIVDVSSMNISSSTPSFLNSIKIKISEVW